MYVEDTALRFRDPASDLAAPRGTVRIASGRPLPAMQAALLRYLREHAGRTISREELAEQVWKQRHFHTSRAIDQAIANLRKRLHADEKIVSVWSAGYRLEVERSSAAKASPARRAT
jgi:DNA-binding response OmpR family regulator